VPQGTCGFQGELFYKVITWIVTLEKCDSSKVVVGENQGSMWGGFQGAPYTGENQLAPSKISFSMLPHISP